jgi:hypothetical protein
VEHLTGEAPTLPPKITLDWKSLPGKKHSSLLWKFVKYGQIFLYHLSLVRAAVKSFATQAQTAIRPRSAIKKTNNCDRFPIGASRLTILWVGVKVESDSLLVSANFCGETTQIRHACTWLEIKTEMLALFLAILAAPSPPVLSVLMPSHVLACFIWEIFPVENCGNQCRIQLDFHPTPFFRNSPNLRIAFFLSFDHFAAVQHQMESIS